jgi:hypothetical protein
METEPELRLCLVPAPDEPPLRSPEYQAELRAFTQALKAQGINVSSTWAVQDAVGGGGWSVGEFVIAATALQTFVTPVRKLIEVLLEVRDGRKLKVQVGTFKLEGGARDVEKTLNKLLEHEQFLKLGTKTPKKTQPE